MKVFFKKITNLFPVLVHFLNWLRFSVFTPGLHIKYAGGGYVRIKKYIRGRDNQMIIGSKTKIDGAFIHIVGNGNTLCFGKNCRVMRGNSFWLEGNGVNITIGDNCTFNIANQVNAQERNSSIVIGRDCMISNHVQIRSSDSHPIFNIHTGKRINVAQNVRIGEHVWIAPYACVYKGVSVDDGSIIASHSLVTHDVPKNVLVAGLPAKIVKENIKWTRDEVVLI